MTKVYDDKTLNYSRADHFEKPANFDVDLNCRKLNEETKIDTDILEDEGLF